MAIDKKILAPVFKKVKIIAPINRFLSRAK